MESTMYPRKYPVFHSQRACKGHCGFSLTFLLLPLFVSFMICILLYSLGDEVITQINKYINKFTTFLWKLQLKTLEIIVLTLRAWLHETGWLGLPRCVQPTIMGRASPGWAGLDKHFWQEIIVFEMAPTMRMHHVSRLHTVLLYWHLNLGSDTPWYFKKF